MVPREGTSKDWSKWNKKKRGNNSRDVGPTWIPPIGPVNINKPKRPSDSIDPLSTEYVGRVRFSESLSETPEHNLVELRDAVVSSVRQWAIASFFAESSHVSGMEDLSVVQQEVEAAKRNLHVAEAKLSALAQAPSSTFSQSNSLQQDEALASVRHEIRQRKIELAKCQKREEDVRALNSAIMSLESKCFQLVNLVCKTSAVGILQLRDVPTSPPLVVRNSGENSIQIATDCYSPRLKASLEISLTTGIYRARWKRG